MAFNSTLIGNTPLLDMGGGVFAKFETYNPSGSVKDRIVHYILERAFMGGNLKEGDTIIEATSGNTGISTSMFGSTMGCKINIVMPCNMSEERKQMMRLFGAHIIEVGEGDFEGAIELRDEMAVDNNWFNLNQFHNPLNVECHYNTTGEEILKQIGNKKIEALILGTGTGGSLMGISRKLKTAFPDLKVVVVEPAESPVMSGGNPGIHGIQGIGDGSKFLVNMGEVDSVEVVSTKDAKNRAKKLLKNGLLVGISSGANVLASERWVERHKPKGKVITMLCDRGERYLSIL